jgi:hypothetical protein
MWENIIIGILTDFRALNTPEHETEVALSTVSVPGYVFRFYSTSHQNTNRQAVHRGPPPPPALLREWQWGDFTNFLDFTKTLSVEEIRGTESSRMQLYANRAPWPRMSAKSVSTLAERVCGVVSAADPYCRILGFLDRSRYFFFQAAPQLYSRGWVDPVPDPLLFRKSDSAGNRTRTSRSVAKNSDQQTTEEVRLLLSYQKLATEQKSNSFPS